MSKTKFRWTGCLRPQHVLCALMTVAVILPVWPLLTLRAAADQAHVRQSAVAEVMPGVFVRTQAGNVVIDTGEQCDSDCPPGSVCESTCRETVCPPAATPLTHCLRCAWDCVW